MLVKSFENAQFNEQKVIKIFIRAMEDNNLEMLQESWELIKKFRLSYERLKEIISNITFQKIRSIFSEIAELRGPDLSYECYEWAQLSTSDPKVLGELLCDVIIIASKYHNLDLALQYFQWLETFEKDPKKFKQSLKTAFKIAVDQGHFGLSGYCWNQLKLTCDNKELKNLIIRSYNLASHWKEISLDMRFQLVKWVSSLIENYIKDCRGPLIAYWPENLSISKGILKKLPTSSLAQHLGLLIYFNNTDNAHAHTIFVSDFKRKCKFFLQNKHYTAYLLSLYEMSEIDKNFFASQKVELDQNIILASDSTLITILNNQAATLLYGKFLSSIYLLPNVDTIQIRNTILAIESLRALVLTSKELLPVKDLPAEISLNIASYLLPVDHRIESLKLPRIKLTELMLNVLRNGTTTILNVLNYNLDDQTKQSFQALVDLGEFKHSYAKAFFIEQIALFDQKATVALS